MEQCFAKGKTKGGNKMAFVIENGDIKKALQNSIKDSIKDRIENACAT